MSHSRKIQQAHREWMIKNPVIDSIEFEDINYSDYPDFCDAFISYAEINGEPMTDTELESLNEDRDFVYEKLMEYLF